MHLTFQDLLYMTVCFVLHTPKTKAANRQIPHNSMSKYVISFQNQNVTAPKMMRNAL